MKHKFTVGSLVKYKHANILEIGIWPQSDWEERFGNKIFQVIKAKEVLVGYPVLDLLVEYSVVEHPRKLMSHTLVFLEPQLICLG